MQMCGWKKEKIAKLELAFAMSQGSARETKLKGER
jgi:hypothetical protein